MNSYFYLDVNGKQQGPVAADCLKAAGVTPATLVWCAGMDNWKPAESVEEIRQIWQTQQETAQPQSPQPEANQTSYGQNNYGQSCNGSCQRLNMPPMPDNYMVWAILTTICCCLPFGIVAIVKASKVKTHYLTGNYERSVLASEEAKKWTIIAFVLGIISNAAFSYFQISYL